MESPWVENRLFATRPFGRGDGDRWRETEMLFWKKLWTQVVASSIKFRVVKFNELFGWTTMPLAMREQVQVRYSLRICCHYYSEFKLKIYFIIQSV